MAVIKLETVTAGPVEGSEGVYHVELSRPDKSNAMNSAFWRDCKTVFDALAEDGDCRVIVLSGQGKNFSAGLDLTDSDNLPPAGEGDVGRQALTTIRHVKPMQDAPSSLENCMKPVICVVHGSCIGAGVDLIAAADVRICTSDAIFCIKEAAVGLAADVGTLARLPKIIGNDSLIRELCYTARPFSAEEAKSFGLVSRVLPSQEEAMAHAMKMASQIAANSPIAVVGTKKNLNFARDHTVADSLDYVRTWNGAMLQSGDVKKAMAAAMSKSKPKYSKL